MFAAAATPIACSNAVLICIDSCYLHPSTCNSELLQAQQKGMWNELIKATLSATAHDKFGGSRSFPIQIIQSCSTTLNTRPKLLELKGSCPSHLQVKDSKKQEIFKFKLSQIISNSSSSIHQTIRERACARRGSRGQWSIQYGHAMTRVQKAKRFQTLTLSNLDLVLNSLRKWREVIKSSRNSLKQLEPGWYPESSHELDGLTMSPQDTSFEVTCHALLVFLCLATTWSTSTKSRTCAWDKEGYYPADRWVAKSRFICCRPSASCAPGTARQWLSLQILFMQYADVCSTCSSICLHFWLVSSRYIAPSSGFQLRKRHYVYVFAVFLNKDTDGLPL